mgnify:CR=1 FL=1
MSTMLWTSDAMATAMRAATQGALPDGVTGLSIDSRTIAKGEAYFAIKGDVHDGHAFVEAALKAGAGLAVVEAAQREKFPAEAPLLVVDDVLAGLVELAHASRARLNAKIIAVTGSVGKTSTKEALRRVLSAQGETHASVASFNNHWGVPLSLARCPASTRFAVFEIGMSEYDSTFVFMPLAEAQAYFNRNNDVSSIEVFTTNPDKIDTYRKLVTEAAGRPVFLVDWRQRNSTFFNALQVERNVMFLILTMIVLVAALNIVSGLIMLVKDKGQDIAILRTMGASQGSIMRIFLITGASIGVVGTLTGFAVGMLICLNIESIRQFLSWLTNTELFSPELYFLSKLPAEVDFGETLAVVIMALTLSFLATLYPSWRAARLDPVEALRYE